MNPGLLKHKIIFQQLCGTPNTYGETEEDEPNNWRDDIKVWAGIFPLSGSELFAAEQANSAITHKILLRYRSDIKPYMRVIYKGRIFEIEYIINRNEADCELELRCRELIR